MALKELQNGSDIRGVALEGRENEPVNLTTDVANKLGKAFALWLERQGRRFAKVAIGMDSRLSGPMLKEGFSGGLTNMGVDVIDIGLASTPAMFMTIVSNNPGADAAVMITASHLPFNRNGFKFFTKNGGLNKADITDLLSIAEANHFTPSSKQGIITEMPFMDDYARFLANYIREGVNDSKQYDTPLRGLKIIVDAGNGAGGFFAGDVLAPLGADTSGSQFLDPDGTFPNHIPNPEDDQAMASICEAVVKQKADLGIIFDTDVDRSAIVDSTGRPINRNELIALIAAVVLKQHPGSTIVTDSITSEGLTQFIEQYSGGTHHRFKRGYKNVINEAIRLNAEGTECHLAIETSGHAALKENHFLDDGAYLVAKLLIEMALLKQRNKTLGSLIESLKAPVESKEFRISIRTNDFLPYGQRVIDQIKIKSQSYEGWVIQEPNYEGVRVKCTSASEKGWFLLRMSLHDPVMPLNIESDISGGVANIAAQLKEMLQAFDHLDLSGFDQ